MVARHVDFDRATHLAFGTVDTWLAWNLTGGASFVTDPSNASRTMLYDIRAQRWSDDLMALFDIPSDVMADVVPSVGACGTTVALGAVPAGVPVASMLGDQQAALFGHACFAPGMAKNTYGTGSFVLMNVGDCPPPADGLLTTVAWQLADRSFTYALEGAIFVTGAAIQWLRDGIGMIADAREIGPLAESVSSSGGVVFVPAFTGLGSPWWDPHARGDRRSARGSAAPRRASSRMFIELRARPRPALSPSTKPSRSLSHGRDAVCGSSLRVDSARAAAKPPTPSGEIVASEPPATMTSASPYSINRAAMPMRVQAGRAGRHHRDVRALEAVGDRHMARDHVDDRGRHEERRDAPRAARLTSSACVSSIIGKPPMPEPMLQPMRTAFLR